MPVVLRPEARYGRDIDDGARPALAHARGHQPDETERALQIHFDHLVELAVVDFEAGSLRDIGCGVVDEDVDFATALR